MDKLREIVLQSEPLLLFLVIGIGFLVGQIRIRGFNLGVAGVLFVGLFFGAWKAEDQPAFSIAHQVTQLGLILFVYAVGLTTGPGFFAALKKRGIRFNIALVISLVVGAVITFPLGMWMKIPVGQISGTYCGGLTNTPALAAVTERVQGRNIGDPSDPVIGYSIAYATTYPVAMIGKILIAQLLVIVGSALT